MSCVADSILVTFHGTVAHPAMSGQSRAGLSLPDSRHSHGRIATLPQCCALGAWLSVEGWEKRQDEDGEDAADAGGWETVSYFFTSAWNAGWPRSGSHSG
jgi:hypothetical protein